MIVACPGGRGRGEGGEVGELLSYVSDVVYMPLRRIWFSSEITYRARYDNAFEQLVSPKVVSFHELARSSLSHVPLWPGNKYQTATVMGCSI